MTAAYVQCSIIRRSGERCTAEALDAGADVLICSKHAARVVRLIRDRNRLAKVDQAYRNLSDAIARRTP